MNTEDLSMTSTNNSVDKYLSDISVDSVNNTKIRLRLFLLAQASKELEKVIKLSDTLDRLQNMYQEKAFEYIQKHSSADEAVTYIPYMMDTIAKCLERSNSLIKQVAGDEKLMSLINIDLSTNISNVQSASADNHNNRIGLNSVSRNKVREAINLITAEMEKSQSEIIDISSEDTQSTSDIS